MENNYGKKVLAVFLLTVLLTGGINNILSGLLPLKQVMVELNGTIAKRLNLRELYRDSGGVVLNNGYIAGIYPYTSTDYEIQQITNLKSYLDEKGIPLLYVNEPTKYIDDAVIETDLGQHTYINDNMDRFLNRLDENRILYLDIRKEIEKRGINSFSLFYKTDHHWTPTASKFAAETIVIKLNEYFDFNIDLSLYDSDRFTYQIYRNVWLGEQGRKLGVSFVGLDDFTLVFPNYDTCFTITLGGVETTGTFEEVLIDHTVFLPERNFDVYNAPSWHYSYLGKQSDGKVIFVNESKVVNCKNPEGKKLLILGDSYEQTMIPFLALGVSQIQCLVLRNYEGSLKEYIEANEIDIVIIAYASFMLGAHDDINSANYSMFNFQ